MGNISCFDDVYNDICFAAVGAVVIKVNVNDVIEVTGDIEAMDDITDDAVIVVKSNGDEITEVEMTDVCVTTVDVKVDGVTLTGFESNMCAKFVILRDVVNAAPVNNDGFRCTEFIRAAVVFTEGDSKAF